MIAAVSAIALFLIMFIFTWFSLPDTPGFDTGSNAWDAFGFIDIVLLVTIIVAVSGAAMSANAQSLNSPVALSAVTAGLGILSVLLILFRIISPPDFGASEFGVDLEVSRSIGVFLGLIAAGGIAYGGWMAMQEEGASFSGDRGPRNPPPAA